MGRHSTRGLRWRVSSPVALLSIVLVLMLVAWGTFAYLRDQLAASGCTVPRNLHVAAAPDIASVVADIARNRPDHDGAHCYRVTVVTKDSTDVAESLAANKSSNFDVWIPESGMSLRLARNRGAWKLPETGKSVATSPVVMAMTAAATEPFGGPSTRPPTMTELLRAGDDPVTIGMPAPGRNPTGLAALLGVKALTEGAPAPEAKFTEAVRKLSDHVVADAGTLFEQLGDDESPQSTIGVFPAPESAVLRYNARPGTEDLVLSYPEVAVPSLKYPYVVLPGTSTGAASDAEHFLSTLLAPEAANAFADAGFRTPLGHLPAGQWSEAPTRVAPEPVEPAQQAMAIRDLLRTWAGVNRSARIHVLLDISGSMAATVAGTERTRLELTVEAAARGLGLFQPTTRLELSLFSTDLQGDRDYRSLLPMRTVAEHLDTGAISRLRSVEPKPNGGTGLYDSVLAAYREATRRWEPGKINIVIALTDGRNDDTDSISLDRLVGELEKLHDPRQPVRVIGIGIGPNIDASELRAISRATEGHAFTTPDPTRISQVFYRALSRIICRTPGCTT